MAAADRYPVLGSEQQHFAGLGIVWPALEHADQRPANQGFPVGADELVGELCFQFPDRVAQQQEPIRVVRDDVLVFGDEVGDLRDGISLECLPQVALSTVLMLPSSRAYRLPVRPTLPGTL